MGGGGNVGAAERDRIKMPRSVREAVGDAVGAPSFRLGSGVGAEPRKGVPLGDGWGNKEPKGGRNVGRPC